jgi:hypothetical protein
MDLIPDQLPLRKSGSAGNPTRDVWIGIQELWSQTTEAVCCYYNILIRLKKELIKIVFTIKRLIVTASALLEALRNI